jgi:hypothetical protein
MYDRDGRLSITLRTQQVNIDDIVNRMKLLNDQMRQFVHSILKVHSSPFKSGFVEMLQCVIYR